MMFACKVECSTFACFVGGASGLLAILRSTGPRAISAYTAGMYSFLHDTDALTMSDFSNDIFSRGCRRSKVRTCVQG